jgi:hypothetical protein
MTKRLIAFAIAIAFAGTCMSTADAQRRGGGGRGGRGMSRPPSRPAQMPTRPSGGYQFKNDIGSPPRPSQLPSGGINRPGNGSPGNRPGNGGNRPAVPPINQRPPNWGWNGGVIWYPAYGYWGGGFWGPYAWGFTTAYVFGEYYDEETKEPTKSYEVAPDSPGADVLKGYGLTQTQCQAQGVVVIFGPEGSVVCATPNETVPAGTYDLNVQDLTITPRAAA